MSAPESPGRDAEPARPPGPVARTARNTTVLMRGFKPTTPTFTRWRATGQLSRVRHSSPAMKAWVMLPPQAET